MGDDPVDIISKPFFEISPFAGVIVVLLCLAILYFYRRSLKLEERLENELKGEQSRFDAMRDAKDSEILNVRKDFNDRIDRIRSEHQQAIERKETYIREQDRANLTTLRDVTAGLEKLVTAVTNAGQPIWVDQVKQAIDTKFQALLLKIRDDR